MIIRCSWCGKDIGYKPGKGITHGICKDCIIRIERESETDVFDKHKSTKQSHDNTIDNS